MPEPRAISQLLRVCFVAAILLAFALVGGAIAQTESRERTTPDDVCVGGACFAGEIEITSETVPIRGAGTLTYLGFRVYSAALYARPEGTALVDAGTSEPLRLVLHYHRKIEKADINKSTIKALNSNPDVNVPAIQTALDQMMTYHQDVKSGDRYELTFEPGRGMRVVFNGTEKGFVAGDEFARAYLGMWLSDHPLSKSLRQKLIGE